MPYQQCTRCVMDNAGDATITFDDAGRCNYCTSAQAFLARTYKEGAQRQYELDALADQIRRDGQGREYDCFVGLSGGMDSCYAVYVGAQLGLRMFCLHIDDGLNTEVATANVKSLCEKTGAHLQIVSPDMEQYKDLLLSFFKASVPNLAIPQDNLIFSAVYRVCLDNNIKYRVIGRNYATESILQRDNTYIVTDLTHIRAIHRAFGTKPIDNLDLMSFAKSNYLKNHASIKPFYPLLYVDYHHDKALREMHEFSGFEDYGEKHHESVLTRFMQCYYLPVKFGVDKRKSHYSSMIMSGQMTRQEALAKLQRPAYASEEIKKFDISFLADFFELSLDEFESIVALPPKSHDDYKKSFFVSRIVPLLRRLRG